MRIDNDIAIARPPEQVWAVVGDLAAATRWVPGVSSVQMEGTRRTCVLEGGGEIQEEITDFSDELRRFSYTQRVHPLGLDRSEGRIVVEANGDGGSRVVWSAEVVAPEEVLEMLRPGYAAALARLKEVAESP